MHEKMTLFGWSLFEGPCTPIAMFSILLKTIFIDSGESKGGRQVRTPPSGSEFFHFHAVFGKILIK